MVPLAVWVGNQSCQEYLSAVTMANKGVVIYSENMGSLKVVKLRSKPKQKNINVLNMMDFNGFTD